MSADEDEPAAAPEGRGTPNPADGQDGGESAVVDALEKAGHLAGDVGRLGLAWIELARAEAAVARLSAVRLALASVAVAALSLLAWVFVCVALGWWLGSAGLPMGWAFAAVAGLNLLIVAVLVFFMRRWRRALLMPDSRAALADIARALSS